jgi:hypothetical protein
LYIPAPTQVLTSQMFYLFNKVAAIIGIGIGELELDGLEVGILEI